MKFPPKSSAKQTGNSLLAEDSSIKTEFLPKSKYDKAILKAYQKGYWADSEGNIYNPRGTRLKLKEKKNKRYALTYLTFRYGRNRNIYVHRFVGYSLFRDKVFDKTLVVRHLDSNPHNNSFSNLKLGSHSQNMMDRPKEVRVRVATHASRCANPRTKKERYRIYKDLHNGLSYRILGEKYGVAKSTLSYIRNHSKEYKEYVLNEHC